MNLGSLPAWLRGAARKLARAVLGEYAAYLIYAGPVVGHDSSGSAPRLSLSVRAIDRTELEQASEPLLREQASYGGSGSHLYACWLDGRMVGVCAYWFGERYRQRNFISLGDQEAKLVQIVTLPQARGQGVASSLIAGSSHDMSRKGFRRCFARIWHSNTPSLRAFEKARWTRQALVVEINPLRRERPLRMRFGLLASGHEP